MMDSPTIAPDEHRRALGGLVTLNRLSLTARILLPRILRLAGSLGRDRLTLLDVACGGGDVPITLQKLAAQRGLQLDLILADKSAVALAQARQAAGSMDVQTVQCDAGSEALPHTDVVINSLFLHHLDAPDVVAKLRHFASRAQHQLLISDLVRSPMGLAVAWTTCRLFSTSLVVRHDGPASVRAAWTRSEMRQMCNDAGLGNAQITRSWPWRMLVSWRREA